jgi:short-subunit dehydrogenase
MSRWLVTGASSGVGAAIAGALGRRGADVWLVGRRRDALDITAEAVRTAGGAATVCAADLASDGDLERLVSAVTEQSDRLAGLVHSAGRIVAPVEVADLAVDDVDAQYRVNLRAPMVLTRRLLPLLDGGDIVLVSSTAALKGVGGSSAYAATKAGLRSFAESLRDELGDRDIRVLTVLLGRTASPMQERLHAAEGRSYRAEVLVQPDDVADAVLGALDLPRRAEVTEISLRPAARPAP